MGWRLRHLVCSVENLQLTGPLLTSNAVKERMNELTRTLEASCSAIFAGEGSFPCDRIG